MTTMSELADATNSSIEELQRRLDEALREKESLQRELARIREVATEGLQQLMNEHSNHIDQSDVLEWADRFGVSLEIEEDVEVRVSIDVNLALHITHDGSNREDAINNEIQDALDNYLYSVNFEWGGDWSE